MENKSFKMRRNGGALNRATENTEEHNISTNSARTMAQYGMSDSGMNFGAPLNSNDDPDKKELKGKKKLPTDGMTYEEKMKYYKKQKENTNPQSSSVTMGLGSNRSSGSNILK